MGKDFRSRFLPDQRSLGVRVSYATKIFDVSSISYKNSLPTQLRYFFSRLHIDYFYFFLFFNRKELAAITLLWEQWMKPTIQKFPYIFEYLWSHGSMEGLQLSQSFLARMGDQRALQRIYDDESFSRILDSRIVDISETTRLNAFALIARNNNWIGPDPFGMVKKFLYFNANASTIFMRKGIIENFKIFFAKVIKISDGNELLNVEVRELIDWLYKFFLDCCEIGSSYQRKILGLSLYGVILNFTLDDSVDGVSTRGTKFVATLKSANALRRRMIEEGNWKLNEHESAMLLMRLVLDQADDVRDKAASILIRYFDPHVFSSSEKKVKKSSNFLELSYGN